MAGLVLKVQQEGLFCAPGGFFVDAWRPVPVCIVTHAHGDHAYWGHRLYIATHETIRIMQHRLGKDIQYRILPYGEKIKLGGCWVSLHPAGHILGSAQVRIEHSDQVTVISGDYKRAADDTCRPFEVVECDTFITEATFALPIYQWPKSEEIGRQIYAWWEENAEKEHPSVLFCYALGKAQRVIHLLNQYTSQPVYLHGAVYPLSKIYQELGAPIRHFAPVSDKKNGFKEDLIIAPPSAMGSPWMKRFPSCKTAFASGWMAVRGNRRRRAVDRGFVLSDHADWHGLVKTIEESRAKLVLTTHGDMATLSKYLREEKDLESSALGGLEENFEEEE